MFKEQTAQLSADLERVTQQLYENRSQQSRKVMELQHNLNDMQQARDVSHEKLDAAQKREKEHQARIEKLAAEIEELRTQQLEEEKNYREENLAQKRLLELYKNEADNAKARAEEAREGITSLRKLLAEAQKETAAVRNDRSQELEHLSQVGRRHKSSSVLSPPV